MCGVGKDVEVRFFQAFPRPIQYVVLRVSVGRLFFNAFLMLDLPIISGDCISLE